MKTYHRKSTLAVLALSTALSTALIPARAAEPTDDAAYAAATIGVQGRTALAALNGQIQAALPGQRAALAGLQAAFDGYRQTRLAREGDCERTDRKGASLRRVIRVHSLSLPLQLTID